MNQNTKMSRNSPTATPPSLAPKDQLILPGADRVSDAEIAKRRAKQPLKPKAAQKPTDEGLFSDESKQTDLVDQLSAKAAKPEA